MKQVFFHTLPIAVSYLFLGASFGILFYDSGATGFEIFFLSLTTFAGAAQFSAIEFFGTDYNPWVLFLTIFVINLRHVIYGLSEYNRFGNWSLEKFYLIFSLTDENYGVLQKLKNLRLTHRSFILYHFALNHAYWVLGSVLGYFFASSPLLKSTKGLEFVLTLLFFLLFFENFKNLVKRYQND